MEIKPSRCLIAKENFISVFTFKLMFIYDIATGDVDDKICLLVELNKDGVEKWEVQVFNETRDLQHKFPVRRGE